ncbi:ATP-binding protein [Piscinibacter sp. XHJ-5]|uniref:ATP-binding protein n=1 Tax=Piscinibacter sp. XHJ-5 TaxID=3037797 RepID=UPI002452EFA9|nr:ATP-binding protein [Piscinibacter sp. XHJ-5]
MPKHATPARMLGALVAPLPADAERDAPSAAPPPSSTLTEVVRSVYDYMPATLLGYIAGIGVICMLFWSATPASVMLPWLAAFTAMWLARVFVWQRFRSAQPQTPAEWKRWLLYWNAGTLTSGALWGSTAWIFFFRGESAQQIGLIVTVYTFCAAAVPVLATQPRVFLVYAALCFVPMAARIASEGSVQSWQLAGILFLIFGLTAVLARNYRQALQREIDLKVHADELLAQLRTEKQAADDARHEAEVANRAKTQFFTAASHDLRQPLHAMGLFAEALRNKSHDEEVAQLVNSINGSVDALEGLFSELLDITRIDTGGVEVNPRSFEVGDIFRKLRLHFEPTAFEKGLGLRLRGGHHVANADPLLVERILRNLVSNAIRYTNDGTVLVGCRRRGDKLLVQVWDTGVGIPEQELSRIFEEFYQVPGNGAPQQRKGLGLGLAIVKRLADLIGAPLTLRSQPGRGTVFSLELPVGRLVKATPAALTSKTPAGLTLDGRTIVVVEDEPAVRSGLEALLRGWGASLVSFDSVAATSAWARQADASARPDLLIVDYRLENGSNGVDAIVALRERFGPLPAIVVTGSTMSTLDREAQEKDFHLLIKPVVPNKLRAMIAFKLKVKAGAST